MKIEIVYDSSTGTTAKAAEKMGKTLQGNGHQVRVQSVASADPADVSEGDLICVGGWVKGLFIIMQHPSTRAMQFIDRLGQLTGKEVAVFCTYKLAAGSTLSKMTAAMESKGAQVVGQFKYRGPEPNDSFASFASSLS
jgi:flavodoxin